MATCAFGGSERSARDPFIELSERAVEFFGERPRSRRPAVDEREARREAAATVKRNERSGERRGGFGRIVVRLDDRETKPCAVPAHPNAVGLAFRGDRREGLVAAVGVELVAWSKTRQGVLQRLDLRHPGHRFCE
jgi:hypothetical protein